MKLVFFVTLILCWHFLVGQIIGSVAVLIALIVFQINNRRKMLHLSAAAALLFALSFFFLQA